MTRNLFFRRILLVCLLGMACASSGFAQSSLGGTTATPVSPSFRPPTLPSAPGSGLPPSAETAPVNVTADYRLETDDTVSISVTRHGDVGGIYHIPPDGLVRLQRLLTPIAVRGKTCDEVSTEITDKLINEGKLVLRPGQVNVIVVGTRIRRIFVRGNAVAGRDFDLKNGWRIADLTALMGGVPQPDRLHARLTNPARPQPIDVDLVQALNHPDSEANLLLEEGDTLSINSPQVKRLIIKNEGPRGIHEFDERFGIKQALVSLGFSVTGASGDLSKARLIRNQVPGDLTTPATYIPIPLLQLLTNDDAKDVPFQDLDTLDIPLSDNWVWVTGAVGNTRKWYLPQDRKTYLVDVFVMSGGVLDGPARIGDVKVIRTTAAGKQEEHAYDLGKFMSKNDASQNPEILPHDTIFVPTVKHTDVVGNIWTGFGLFNLLKVFAPGLSPHL